MDCTHIRAPVKRSVHPQLLLCVAGPPWTFLWTMLRSNLNASGYKYMLQMAASLIRDTGGKGGFVYKSKSIHVYSYTSRTPCALSIHVAAQDALGLSDTQHTNIIWLLLVCSACSAFFFFFFFRKNKIQFLNHMGAIVFLNPGARRCAGGKALG